MSQRSANRRFVVPWLVAGLVCGCLAQAGFPAAQEEAQAQPAETAPAEGPPSQLVIYRLQEAKADAVVKALSN